MGKEEIDFPTTKTISGYKIFTEELLIKEEPLFVLPYLVNILSLKHFKYLKFYEAIILQQIHFEICRDGIKEAGVPVYIKRDLDLWYDLKFRMIKKEHFLKAIKTLRNRKLIYMRPADKDNTLLLSINYNELRKLEKFYLNYVEKRTTITRKPKRRLRKIKRTGRKRNPNALFIKI